MKIKRLTFIYPIEVKDGENQLVITGDNIGVHQIEIEPGVYCFTGVDSVFRWPDVVEAAINAEMGTGAVSVALNPDGGRLEITDDGIGDPTAHLEPGHFDWSLDHRLLGISPDSDDQGFDYLSPSTVLGHFELVNTRVVDSDHFKQAEYFPTDWRVWFVSVVSTSSQGPQRQALYRGRTKPMTIQATHVPPALVFADMEGRQNDLNQVYHDLDEKDHNGVNSLQTFWAESARWTGPEEHRQCLIMVTSQNDDEWSSPFVWASEGITSFADLVDDMPEAAGERYDVTLQLTVIE